MDAQFQAEELLKNSSDYNVFDSKQLVAETISKYKFYLAVESSQCRDLISMNVFDGIINNAVPVVAGANISDYLNILPGSSFLHLDNYKHIKDLARHLNYLLDPANLEKYLELKYWIKNFEEISTKLPFQNTGVCGLCKVAKNLKAGVEMNFPVVEDLNEFWFGNNKTGSICKTEASQ